MSNFLLVLEIFFGKLSLYCYILKINTEIYPPYFKDIGEGGFFRYFENYFESIEYKIYNFRKGKEGNVQLVDEWIKCAWCGKRLFLAVYMPEYLSPKLYERVTNKIFTFCDKICAGNLMQSLGAEIVIFRKEDEDEGNEWT